MRKRIVVLLIGLVLAVGMPSIALGGAAFTMHPAGRGQQTYASWKANVGEPDPGGIGNQAIFMQKNSDSDDATAVVVIRGLAGTTLSNLQPLSWDRPKTGPGSHCGNAPHWRITVTREDGTTDSANFGFCQAGQTHTQSALRSDWFTDTCTSCAADLSTAFGSTAAINSLAIVFDECCDFVLLDHITVGSATDGAHTWDSASDNGITALTIGPLVAYADVVSDVLGDLLKLFPGVPATEWTLYTGVDVTPLP